MLRSVLTVLAAAALVVPALAFAAGSDQPQTITSHEVPDAERYVQTLADQVTGVLNSGASESGKEQQIRQMIDSDLDGDAIAKYTLGALWKQATPAEFAEFVSLLKQYASSFYQGRLNEFQGAKMNVTGSLANGAKAVVVGSSIKPPKGGDPVFIDWLVIRTGTSFKLIDFRFSGVWIARSWGDQFTSIVDQAGGKFQALNDHLKQQLASGAHDVK